MRGIPEVGGGQAPGGLGVEQRGEHARRARDCLDVGVRQACDQQCSAVVKGGRELGRGSSRRAFDKQHGEAEAEAHREVDAAGPVEGLALRSDGLARGHQRLRVREMLGRRDGKGGSGSGSGVWEEGGKVGRVKTRESLRIEVTLDTNRFK